jgi:ribosomal protein L37E
MKIKSKSELRRVQIQCGSVFKAKDSNKLYLVRCPKCERENYAPAVATGQCVWCGYAAIEKDINS